MPTGCLKGDGLVGHQLGVGADGLWVHGPAVHVSVVVASLTIAHHLQRLAELHNLRRQAREAQHPSGWESHRFWCVASHQGQTQGPAQPLPRP